MIAAAIRIGPAILVDAVAFMLWNLVARSPLTIAHDIINGFKRPGSAFRGILAFATGLVLFACAVSILTPLLLDAQSFAFLETWTLVTGLLLEALVGPEIRARSRRRRARRAVTGEPVS